MAGKKIVITGGCGMIGSALIRHLQSRGHECLSIDMERRGNPGNVPNYKTDFAWFRPAHFGVFDVVVHLAASATVYECKHDPYRAFFDNLVQPVGLLDRLDGQTFIYASSGSVLSRNGVTSVYDYTKLSFEQAVAHFYPQAVGLRFGTVCGPSPNIRGTMLNAMVENAHRHGRIVVSNRSARRPILGVKDLCRAVEQLIDFPRAGVHELCSFNTTVRAAAEAVTARYGCMVDVVPDTPTYDFAMRGAEWFDPHDSMDSIIDDLQAHYAAATVEETV